MDHRYNHINGKIQPIYKLLRGNKHFIAKDTPLVANGKCKDFDICDSSSFLFPPSPFETNSRAIIVDDIEALFAVQQTPKLTWNKRHIATAYTDIQRNSNPTYNQIHRHGPDFNFSAPSACISVASSRKLF